jgi:hypothetical protein
MRQIVPHRNNIVVQRTKCKIFFAARGREKVEWRSVRRSITFRSHEIMAAAVRYSHTKQGLMETVGIDGLGQLKTTGMAHMHFSQDTGVIYGRPA